MRLYEANEGEEYYIKKPNSKRLSEYFEVGSKLRVLTHTYMIGPTIVELENKDRLVIPYSVSKSLELQTSPIEVNEKVGNLEAMTLACLVRCKRL